jgi:hypothetical protein
LSYSDIAIYPSLALPEGSYPKVEESLKSIGLWNDVEQRPAEWCKS